MKKVTNWLGNERLVQILENGLEIGVNKHQCTFEEKVRIVYGHEQILPVVNHL